MLSWHDGLAFLVVDLLEVIQPVAGHHHFEGFRKQRGGFIVLFGNHVHRMASDRDLIRWQKIGAQITPGQVAGDILLKTIQGRWDQG